MIFLIFFLIFFNFFKLTLTSIRFKSVKDTLRCGCEHRHASVVTLRCEVHLQVRSNQDSLPSPVRLENVGCADFVWILWIIFFFLQVIF